MSGTPIPSHGYCYICGPENPSGLGLVWYEAEGKVHSDFTLGREQQGPPGHVHGGATAAILDEGMGKAVWRAGLQVLAASMTVNWRRPAPLGVPLRAEAEVERVEGRKAYTTGRLLLPDGEVAAEATGLYVHVPGFFEETIARGGWG